MNKPSKKKTGKKDTRDLLREEIKKLVVFADQAETYKEIIEASPIPIAILDHDYDYLDQNTAHAHLTGYETGEIKGKNPEILLGEGIFSQITEKLDQGHTVEVSLHPKESPSKLTLFQMISIGGKGEKEQYFVTFHREITQEKRMEMALKFIAEAMATKGGQEFFQSILQYLMWILEAPCGLISQIKGPKVQVLSYWNGREFLEDFELSTVGTPCEKVLSGKIQFYPRDLQKIFPGYSLAQDLGAKSYLGVPLRDSSQKVIGHLALFHTLPMEEGLQKRYILEIFANRAGLELERLESIKALKQSESLYRNLVEQAPLGISTIDRNGKITKINSKLLQLLGSPSRADTEAINVLTFPLLVASGISADIRHCMESGEMVIARRPYKSKWGKEIYMRYHISPIKDDQGEVVGAQAIIEDFTEQMELEERIRRQDRLATVGQLAAGIAHDFNNTLQSIMGYAEFLKNRTDIPPEAKRDAEIIRQQGERASRLIRQILDYSSRSLQERMAISLSEFFEKNMALLRRTLPENIQLSFQGNSKNPHILGDPGQLSQVITNLAINARDAMPEGGQWELSLDTMEILQGKTPLFLGMNPGEWVVASFSDSGKGIPKEIQSKIFDPFFTTKEVGKGSGLGLSQVYGIVTQHGGFIDMESREGKGTTFYLYFPLYREGVEWRDCPASQDTSMGKGEVILVAEDNESVLDLLKRMMGNLGYKVLTANNGKEALKLFRQRSDEIDLLCSDMTMPQMGGKELAQEVWKIRPNMKILLLTGYPLGMEDEKEFFQKVSAVLKKPVTFKDLGQTLANTLRG